MGLGRLPRRVDEFCASGHSLAKNFWLHGIRGEVAHMNSLSLEWYFAYQTHPRLSWPFVTFLGQDRKEESVMYLSREALSSNQQAKPAVVDLFNQPET